MERQEMNLNISYDGNEEIWCKIPGIYLQLEGWLGFGEGGDKGHEGIPYWYSYNEKEQHICASVEPSGLFFTGLMNDEEWEVWKNEIKEISTKVLGYKVGEIELGEVDH